jgi:hypothetical protein
VRLKGGRQKPIISKQRLLQIGFRSSRVLPSRVCLPYTFSSPLQETDIAEIRELCVDIMAALTALLDYSLFKRVTEPEKGMQVCIKVRISSANLAVN